MTTNNLKAKKQTACSVNMQQLKVLHLTLKKGWFDMIASGEKTEEYREIKPHYQARLIDKHYDFIEFRNGYGHSVPKLRVKLESISVGFGNTDLGAPKNKEVFILRLGEIMQDEWEDR